MTRAGATAAGPGPRCLRERVRGALPGELRAGSDTPNHLLPLGARRLAAARAAGENPAEYLAAVETLWLRSWNIEQLTRERVESGIKAFTSADVYEARDRRLETSVPWLAKAPSGGRNAATVAGQLGGLAPRQGMPTRSINRDVVRGPRRRRRGLTSPTSTGSGGRRSSPSTRNASGGFGTGRTLPTSPAL